MCEKEILKIIKRNEDISYRFNQKLQEEKDIEKEESGNILDEERLFYEVSYDEEVLNESVNIFEKEVDNIGRFNNYTSLTVQVADLKEFIKYKMGQVISDSNDQLITQLESEKFLRDELRESKKLISDILESQRRVQSDGTNMSNHEQINRFESQVTVII